MPNLIQYVGFISPLVVATMTARMSNEAVTVMIVPAMGIAMGKWFMPAFLIVIFGNIIVTVVRLIRNR
jgi:hypothetical protein